MMNQLTISPLHVHTPIDLIPPPQNIYIFLNTFRIRNCSFSLPVIRCSTPKSISNADAGIDTVPSSELIDDDTARRDASGLSVHMYV